MQRWTTRAAVGTAVALVATVGALAPTAAHATPGALMVAQAPSVAAVPGRRTPEERAFVRALRQRVVDTAVSRVGFPYVWGGSGPDSFDCSGLVMWSYATALGTVLPHYSGAQMTATTPVTGKLRRGDLLFYGPDGSQHVSMYIGKGQMVSANNPTSGIVIEPIDGSYWAARYVGAGRVII